MARNASLLSPGQVVSETYEVERLLGQGGMGEVWLAKHRRLAGKQVAIKVMHLADESSSPELLGRFRREAEIAARLDHPNIVQVLDFDALPSGAPFLVMEYLKGESLASRARGQPMRLDDVRAIVRQVGSALAAAHAAGVVHRDLKPDNIFLVPTALGDQVKVLDFGISKLSESSTVQTTDAVLMGTPRYMSPEQALGRNRDLTAQSDLFSLGAICYELLSGQPPFAAETIAQLVFRIAYEPHPPLDRVAPHLPSDAVAAIERALAKEVALRTRDIATFVLELTGTPLAAVAPTTGRAGQPGLLEPGMQFSPSLAEGATRASAAAGATPSAPRRSSTSPVEAGARGAPPDGAGAVGRATPAPDSGLAASRGPARRPWWSPQRALALMAALAVVTVTLALLKLRSTEGPAGGDVATPSFDAGPASKGSAQAALAPDAAPSLDEDPAKDLHASAPTADQDGGPALDGGPAPSTDSSLSVAHKRPVRGSAHVPGRGADGEGLPSSAAVSEADAALVREVEAQAEREAWDEIMTSSAPRVLQLRDAKVRARLLPWVVEAACRQRRLAAVKDNLDRLRKVDRRKADEARRRCRRIWGDVAL